jgi:hypothetical protein
VHILFSMREFALFILRNRWTALLVAGLFGIAALKLAPFALLSTAALGLVALRQGWQDGLFVAAGAGLLVGAGGLVLESPPGLDFPLVFALWPPVLAASEVLRRTESQGAALLTVGLTVLGFVLGMHLITGDVVQFWHDWLRRAVAAVPGATVRGFEEENTLRLINGFVAILYGLSLMFALLVARWLQSLVYHPGGFGAEFRRLRLPRLVLPALVAAVWAAGTVSPVLVADLFMVSMLVYFFVGLAVIHGVIAVRGLPWGWAVPVYLALFYLPQFALSGLALLGALDTLVNFREQRPKR